MNIIANMQIITNEISFHTNPNKGEQFTIQPLFSRDVGSTDDEHFFTRLRVEIKNTKENPFPFDVTADITGIFESKSIPEETREDFQKHQAVSILFPYIRNAVASITANAFVQPILIPILDVNTLFQD